MLRQFSKPYSSYSRVTLNITGTAEPHYHVWLIMFKNFCTLKHEVNVQQNTEEQKLAAFLPQWEVTLQSRLYCSWKSIHLWQHSCEAPALTLFIRSVVFANFSGRTDFLRKYVREWRSHFTRLLQNSGGTKGKYVKLLLNTGFCWINYDYFTAWKIYVSIRFLKLCLVF